MAKGPEDPYSRIELSDTLIPETDTKEVSVETKNTLKKEIDTACSWNGRFDLQQCQEVLEHITKNKEIDGKSFDALQEYQNNLTIMKYGEEIYTGGLLSHLAYRDYEKDLENISILKKKETLSPELLSQEEKNTLFLKEVLTKKGFRFDSIKQQNDSNGFSSMYIEQDIRNTEGKVFDTEYFFVLRGTDKSVFDLDDDLQILFGSIADQNNENIQAFSKVLETLPKGKKISVYGHSLGGYLAQMLAVKYPNHIKDVKTYDPVGIPKERYLREVFSLTRSKFQVTNIVSEQSALKNLNNLTVQIGERLDFGSDWKNELATVLSGFAIGAVTTALMLRFRVLRKEPTEIFLGGLLATLMGTEIYDFFRGKKPLGMRVGNDIHLGSPSHSIVDINNTLMDVPLGKMKEGAMQEFVQLLQYEQERSCKTGFTFDRGKCEENLKSILSRQDIGASEKKLIYESLEELDLLEKKNEILGYLNLAELSSIDIDALKEKHSDFFNTLRGTDERIQYISDMIFQKKWFSSDEDSNPEWRKQVEDMVSILGVMESGFDIANASVFRYKGEAFSLIRNKEKRESVIIVKSDISLPQGSPYLKEVLESKFDHVFSEGNKVTLIGSNGAGGELYYLSDAFQDKLHKIITVNASVGWFSKKMDIQNPKKYLNITGRKNQDDFKNISQIYISPSFYFCNSFSRGNEEGCYARDLKYDLKDMPLDDFKKNLRDD